MARRPAEEPWVRVGWALPLVETGEHPLLIPWWRASPLTPTAPLLGDAAKRLPTRSPRATFGRAIDAIMVPPVYDPFGHRLTPPLQAHDSAGRSVGHAGGESLAQ